MQIRTEKDKMQFIKNAFTSLGFFYKFQWI